MAARLAVDVLLVLACGLTLIGAAAVWRMRDPYQRLHYLALPCGLAAPLIVLAVLIHDPQKIAAAKVALAALVLFALNSVVTHATARAVWVREHGCWPPQTPPPPPPGAEAQS